LLIPCYSNENWEDDYTDCLANIIEDIFDVEYSYVIFGGDLNINPLSKNATHTHALVIKSLELFMHNLNLKLIVDNTRTGPVYTFHVETTGANSCIDYFAVNAVTTLDSGINFSDHCSVSMYICIPSLSLPKVSNNPQMPGVHRRQQCAFRWDKGDVVSYYFLTHDMLSTIQAPTNLLTDFTTHNIY